MTEQDTEKDPLTRGKDNINSEKNQTTDDMIDHAQIKRKKYVKWGLIGAAIIIALILVITLPIVLTRKDDNGGGGDDNGPVPQPPLDKVNPYTVDKSKIKDNQVSFSGVLNVGPAALARLFAQPQSSSKDKPFLLRADPVPPPPSNKLNIDWTTQLNKTIDKNNQFAFNLDFSMDMIDYKVARFTLTDSKNKRFSIPDQILNKPGPNPTMRLEMLGFNYSLDPFSFSFSDVINPQNPPFLTTEGNTMVFMDKYIQMDFTLQSQRLFGFGERIHEFQLGEGTWTMWATGQDSPYDDGKGRKGLYGVHPFILIQNGNSKSDFFGMFFRNSNAQSPVIRYNDDKKTTTLSYITTGGQIELYFFLHGTAQDVIKQYHNLIGKPQLPPFWSLGWQQASWKYINQSMVQDVVDNYAKDNFPLEVVYFDIPYLNNYADFSIDTKAFPDVKGFAAGLHAKDQKLVVIIDAAISAEDTENKYYKQGNDDGIFIQSTINKDSKYGKNLISKVWPQKAVFVDWLHEKCPNTWNMGLDDLYKDLPYDGLWIDMNEATTFRNGENDPTQSVEVEQAYQIHRKISGDIFNDDNSTVWFDSLNGNVKVAFDTYHLPFVVRNSENTAGNYDNMTLSLNATHPGWNDESEYNLHSLYGHMMSWRTHNYLSARDDKRPFILTRSTFASTGRFASHWLGDNLREWAYLRYSIAGIMNMNMFGVPHVGADVCGFFGPKREDEMCLRWIQLSTFYPFARAHQNLTYLDSKVESERSEVYLMAEPYKSDARSSLYDRYAYLRLQYTCLFEISQNGGTCFDPLFYQYPTDENLYQDYEESFMVAGVLKVSPVLAPLSAGTKTFQSYFPQDKWVNLANLNEVIDTSKAGANVTLTVLPTVNVHLKQGALIPYQAVGDMSVKTTADLLKKPISILAHRDGNGFASGSIFLDGGISSKELKDQQYEHYQIRLQAQSFQFKLDSGLLGNQPHVLDKLLIANAADLKGINFACAYDHSMSSTPMTVNYIASKLLLELKTDNETPLKFSDVTYVYFGNSDNGDLNMCDPLAFQYKIKDGKVPDLKTNKVDLILQHVGGTQPDLGARIQFTDANIINVKWTYQAVGNKRQPVEVPTELIDTTPRSIASKPFLLDYIQVTANPFTVQFIPRNKLDKTPYFTLKGMLMDSYLNFIQTQVKVPSGDNFKGIFGLGERAYKNFFYEDGVYTMWAKDQGTPDEDGKPPTKGMYGTHPFYMFRHDSQSWAGVFTKLAHAQDWHIKNSKDTGNIDIKTIATGGLGDIYILTDQQQPEKIIDLYYSLIGDPVLIPQWALGWNQCKWGYFSAQDLQDSVDNYKKYDLPLDVQWSDIDYMSNYKDFTYDTNAYAGLPDFINKLHDNNMYYVPILDAGVAMRPNVEYKSYDDGVKDGIFLTINSASGVQNFIGKVWPNEALYPDFFNPKTTPWWHAQLDSMFANIPFDGLWEDMNEVSNFCDGLCYDSQKPAVQVKNVLPYSPGGADLEAHTASLDAQHANNYLQLDTHSYWGTQEVKATHEWFQKQNKRTFIIERSSFAGMGKFGSRWLGDNQAVADHMGYSVTGIMLMNMFGIQLSGSDICGFGGNTTPELCARWHMVGAFYPFSRNHNAIGSIPQEPWQFMEEYEDGVKYIDIMRTAINIKYSLIRYYYTEMFLASWGTSQVYRKSFYKPLFFSFPEDMNAFNNLRYNVMLGDALKLSLNSDTLNSTTTTFYFPAGTWCDVFNPKNKCINSTTGQNVDLPSKAYDYAVHLRQGKLVALQDAAGLKIMNTHDLQQKPIDIHVLGQLISTTDPTNKNWRAQGIYVNDDGITLNVTNKWNRYDITVDRKFEDPAEKITMNILQTVVATDFKDKDAPGCNAVNKNDYIGNIYIYNAASFKINTKYTVSGIKNQDATHSTSVQIGDGIYDAATDRIVFSAAKDAPVCLSIYDQIEFIAGKSD